MVIAEEQVVSWSGAAEAFLRYTEHIKIHATSVLDRVANAAKQAGVPCDTIQVQDVQPYEGIIGHGPGLRSHRHGIAWMQRTIRSCAWQCDKQGTDVHESSGVGVSVNARAARLAATFAKPHRKPRHSGGVCAMSAATRV